MADEIVVDTGPLIAFASIGRLDLVRKIFSRVLIPEAVRNEVFASGGTIPGADAVAAVSWLETITV